MSLRQFDLRGARYRDRTGGVVLRFVGTWVKPVDVWFVNPCVPVVRTRSFVPEFELLTDLFAQFSTSFSSFSCFLNSESDLC